MFYLLEDNRIIDSKDYWEYAVGIDKDGKTCYRVKIKKQSEKVFDLIEKTDLVKIKFGDSFNILEACHIGGGVNGMRGIIAIYKPDSQGNYIKVWEKKDVNSSN